MCWIHLRRLAYGPPLSDARHSPEIAYLRMGENGLVVQGDAGAYAEVIIGLLQNPSRYEQLQAGALASAQRYTLQNMGGAFCWGIEALFVDGTEALVIVTVVATPSLTFRNAMKSQRFGSGYKPDRLNTVYRMGERDGVVTSVTHVLRFINPLQRPNISAEITNPAVKAEDWGSAW